MSSSGVVDPSHQWSITSNTACSWRIDNGKFRKISNDKFYCLSEPLTSLGSKFYIIKFKAIFCPKFQEFHPTQGAANYFTQGEIQPLQGEIQPLQGQIEH